MRGNADMHNLVAPGELGAVLQLLAAEPGEWTPLAGGTEVMVAFSAGRLAAPKLVSLGGTDGLADEQGDHHGDALRWQHCRRGLFLRAQQSAAIGDGVQDVSTIRERMIEYIAGTTATGGVTSGGVINGLTGVTAVYRTRLAALTRACARRNGSFYDTGVTPSPS